MCSNLRHQSRRALSRDWVASEIGVHEDCDFVNSDFVNVFVSSKSHRSAALGFARFSGTKSKSRGSLILLAKCVAVSAKSNLSWATFGGLTQADLFRVGSHVVFSVSLCSR